MRDDLPQSVRSNQTAHYKNKGHVWSQTSGPTLKIREKQPD